MECNTIFSDIQYMKENLLEETFDIEMDLWMMQIALNRKYGLNLRLIVALEDEQLHLCSPVDDENSDSVESDSVDFVQIDEKDLNHSDSMSVDSDLQSWGQASFQSHLFQ